MSALFGVDPDDSDAEPGSEPKVSHDVPEYVIPDDESGGDGEPFWDTTFLIEIPSGAWEEGDGFACKALDDDFTVTSENGPLNVLTVSIDLSPSEIVGDVCRSRAVMLIGDFENLGSVYTFSTDLTVGTISDRDLLSGQGGGADRTLILELKQ